jgi:hypothetical protein
MMTLSIELHSIRSLNESSEASSSDELYVLVTVASVRPPIAGLPIPAIPDFRVFSYGVFGDMDDDDAGPVIVGGPPFWGMDGAPEDIADPTDVAIVVSVMEQDNGTPAQYAELVNAKTGLSLAASAGAPSPAARAARLAADISNVLNAIDVPIPFAFDDDHIGTQQFVLDQSDMISSGSKDRTMRFDGDGATVELGLVIHRVPQPVVEHVDPTAPRVPGVIGLSIADAGQVLSDAGYGTQSRLAPSGTVEPGIVIFQDPAAETPAFPPLTVHLVVAAEPVEPTGTDGTDGPEETQPPFQVQ